MVKLRGPLMSFDAHGWLGKYPYARTGYVPNVYPIALLPYGLNISQYYSIKGWVYQTRRTWHGIQPIAMRPPISVGTNTLERQVWRTVFADANVTWNGLDGDTKDVYNKLRYPLYLTGQQRFIKFYLEDIRRQMPISPTNVIDHWDQELHDGKLFTVSFLFQDTADNGTEYFLIKVDADVDLHTQIIANVEGEWEVYFYEDPTITDNGNVLTPHNKNREHADDEKSLFYESPTIGDDGTPLSEQSAGAGRSESAGEAEDKWILKAGENYLVKIINRSGKAASASVEVIFAEETP